MIDISVVIPTHIQSHNRASAFLKVLRNLSQQTIPRERYEVIIVEDGVNISTWQALNDMLCQMQNVALVHQTKKGPSAARNIGVRLAKGGIILFMGDDIIIENNLLEAHLKAHESHKDCILVNPVCASENARLGKDILEIKFEGVLEGVEYEMPTGREFCTACVSIKKRLIEKEIFDENFLYAAYEDTDVGYRLHKLGVHFVCIRNTYAVHEHIHSIDSILKRSKNCGHAFSYLSKKHPQLNVGIRWEALSAKRIIKNNLYSFISSVFKMLGRYRSIIIPAWGIKIMCNYSFAKGVEEGGGIMRFKQARIQKLFNFLLNLLTMHRLRTVVFFVTNKCNASCKTCFYWESLNKNIKELSLSEISNIASNIGRFDVLQISGGEPFLRKDLSKICGIFVSSNRIERVHIPTNCLLPDEICSETEKIMQLSPKIKVVICCALDGLGPTHDMIRGVEGNFEKFLTTIKLLKALKQRYDNLGLQVLTTLNKDNYGDYEKIRDFVVNKLELSHSIDIVRKNTAREKSIESIPQSFLEKFYEPPPEILRVRSLWDKLSENIRYEQARTFNILYQESRRKESGALKCSAGKNVVVIEPDGNVRFCESQAAVGNLREHNYRMRDVMRTQSAYSMKLKINNEHCVCDNSLFLTSSLLYNRYYAIKNVIRGIFRTILT